MLRSRSAVSSGTKKQRRAGGERISLGEEAWETAGRCGALLSLLSLLACDDPVRPDPLDFDILGYTVSGQANGTDAMTGETLSCGFYILQLDTGGPLVGSWTDTTAIKVIRSRTTPTLTVTHDTTITDQEVTLTVSDSFHIRVAINGPFTADLTADMIPAYPGHGTGTWTCDTGHPLSQVQPDAVLPGQWHSQPILNIPFE
jgi:hypothetical protein